MKATKTVSLLLQLEVQEEDGELKVIDAYIPAMVEGKYQHIYVGDLQKNCRGNVRRWLEEDYQELLQKEINK